MDDVINEMKKLGRGIGYRYRGLQSLETANG